MKLTVIVLEVLPKVGPPVPPNPNPPVAQSPRGLRAPPPRRELGKVTKPRQPGFYTWVAHSPSVSPRPPSPAQHKHHIKTSAPIVECRKIVMDTLKMAEDLKKNELRKQFLSSFKADIQKKLKVGEFGVWVHPSLPVPAGSTSARLSPRISSRKLPCALLGRWGCYSWNVVRRALKSGEI